MYKLSAALLFLASTAMHGQLSSAPVWQDKPPILLASAGIESSSLPSGIADFVISGDSHAFLSSSYKFNAARTAASSLAYGTGYFKQFMDAPGFDKPVGSLAATFTYTLSGEIAGSNRSLIGWTLTPELNFKKYLAIQADFSNQYVQSGNPAQTRLYMTAGPRLNLPSLSRVTPFVFAEGGEVRRSVSGSLVKDWNPVAKAGVGLDYQVVRGFGVQLVPGEYIGQLNDDGTWLHSFSVRGGIVFSFYR